MCLSVSKHAGIFDHSSKAGAPPGKLADSNNKMVASPSIASDRLKFQNQGMTNLRIIIALGDDHQVHQAHEVHHIHEVHQVVWGKIRKCHQIGPRGSKIHYRGCILTDFDPKITFPMSICAENITYQ